jgi:hypothetical protein
VENPGLSCRTISRVRSRAENQRPEELLGSTSAQLGLLNAFTQRGELASASRIEQSIKFALERERRDCSVLGLNAESFANYIVERWICK